MKNPTASEMGRKGGAAKSDAKTHAARANGAKGGAPKSRYCEMCDRWFGYRSRKCPACGAPTQKRQKEAS